MCNVNVAHERLKYYLRHPKIKQGYARTSASAIDFYPVPWDPNPPNSTGTTRVFGILQSGSPCLDSLFVIFSCGVAAAARSVVNLSFSGRSGYPAAGRV